MGWGNKSLFKWSRSHDQNVVCDIKVGRCSQPSEYMKLYDYQRSSTDLRPRSLRFHIFKLSLKNPRQIEDKFHVEPPWDREMKVSTNGLCHTNKMATMSIYGKNI